VPVVPTIPWAKSADVQSCGPGFNTKIQALYAAYPQVVHGPDLWSYFKANPSLISGDGLHPSAAGYAGFRQQWANAMLANVYGS
jgi:lysophospholipase L1-like esterase